MTQSVSGCDKTGIPACVNIKILTVFSVYSVGPGSANNERMSQSVTR